MHQIPPVDPSSTAVLIAQSDACMRLGYVLREPFGAYAHDPLSVFMEKTLV